MNTTTPGRGGVAPSFISVKRKATGLTEYYEVRQTPNGAMNIPISKQEYDSKTGDGKVTSTPTENSVKSITEYAIKEAGAYVLSGDWYATREEARMVIDAMGAVAPMFQVVEVTYDDLEAHVPNLLAQVQKNRIEEADILAVEEQVAVEALAEKQGKKWADLSHSEKVALASQYHQEAE